MGLRTGECLAKAHDAPLWSSDIWGVFGHLILLQDKSFSVKAADAACVCSFSVRVQVSNSDLPAPWFTAASSSLLFVSVYTLLQLSSTWKPSLHLITPPLLFFFHWELLACTFCNWLLSWLFWAVVSTYLWRSLDVSTLCWCAPFLSLSSL